MGRKDWVWDLPAVQRRPAERQLLSGADIRSLRERHCIATEAGPIPDRSLFGEPVAISAVKQATLIAVVRKCANMINGDDQLASSLCMQRRAVSHSTIKTEVSSFRDRHWVFANNHARLKTAGSLCSNQNAPTEPAPQQSHVLAGPAQPARYFRIRIDIIRPTATSNNCPPSMPRLNANNAIGNCVCGSPISRSADAKPNPCNNPNSIETRTGKRNMSVSCLPRNASAARNITLSAIVASTGAGGNPARSSAAALIDKA